ncbi:ribonuclease P protein component [Nocardioides jishulii]|uniref:Ribonuclease P protein component n=1 Tax=Nocardioides jishulii TaxID=2575440 RepID=A0A4U2YRS2_9ACTN|nr:ribonuclease P protein component [Nocardioides jishulii]QCX29001.1 ribonuclease P protein component [Nocardioides jishulii]TKI64098.1 ribonuclease P protein component [Nocardioides jishulii]
MLPRHHRLTESSRFRQAVRRGQRTGTRTLVLHWLADDGIDPSQVGFVVSKAVGNAVARNRVQRRLRHLTREHLQELPGRGVLVVRANPSAAEASYQSLQGDLRKGLHRLQPAGTRS